MKKGKKICEQLKQIRLDIARANSIEYTPRECHHEGDCAGTCPACDEELRYLENAISRKRATIGKAAIVGISMGLASLPLTSCMGQTQGALEAVEDSTEVITEGVIPRSDHMDLTTEGMIQRSDYMDLYKDTVLDTISYPQDIENANNE